MQSRHEIMAASAMVFALFLMPGYLLALLLTSYYPPVSTPVAVTLFLAVVFAAFLWLVTGFSLAALICSWNDTAFRKRRFWEKRPPAEGFWLDPIDDNDPLPNYITH